MNVEQIYTGCLAQGAYYISHRGEAAIIDPLREVQPYIDRAQKRGETIKYVFETHFHADFVSGHQDLSRKTGAPIIYGPNANPDFNAHIAEDGEEFKLGGLTIRALHTPGHTMESTCYLLLKEDGTPHCIFTGDTLFIGDVGRPDLLASVGVTAEELGRQLFHSLHEKLLTLPDATKVYPAHGAGSACGKNLSTETVSTIGEQRETNYALAPMSEDEFVDAVTQGQSVAPLYFSFAANRNREVRELLTDDVRVSALSLTEVLTLQRDGAVVVDARDDMAFASGHLRGSVNVGLGGRFAEYTGEVMKPGTPIVLVTPPGHEAEALVRLARIGFDNVLGALAEPFDAFIAHPEHVEHLSRLSAAALAERVKSVPDLVLVDVRNPGEVQLGTIAGARHISLPALLSNLDQLDPAAPTVVFCAGGYRSAIASSLLRSHGFTDVSDLIGGYTAWQTHTTSSTGAQ